MTSAGAKVSKAAVAATLRAVLSVAVTAMLYFKFCASGKVTVALDELMPVRTEPENVPFALKFVVLVVVVLDPSCDVLITTAKLVSVLAADTALKVMLVLVASATPFKLVVYVMVGGAE